jgi:hypothetical protein
MLVPLKYFFKVGDKMKNLCFSLFIIMASMSTLASEVESLSPDLRSLLIKEMQSLKQGILSINELYIAGETSKIAVIAKKMQNSYILKQSITAEQKKELMKKLPKHFIQMDKKFHHIAGMLSHVAEEGHMDLIGFYQYKLSESCSGCHSQFAQHRFPGFKKQADSDHHH